MGFRAAIALLLVLGLACALAFLGCSSGAGGGTETPEEVTLDVTLDGPGDAIVETAAAVTWDRMYGRQVAGAQPYNPAVHTWSQAKRYIAASAEPAERSGLAGAVYVGNDAMGRTEAVPNATYRFYYYIFLRNELRTRPGRTTPTTMYRPRIEVVDYDHRYFKPVWDDATKPYLAFYGDGVEAVAPTATFHGPIAATLEFGAPRWTPAGATAQVTPLERRLTFELLKPAFGQMTAANANTTWRSYFWATLRVRWSTAP
jgi:hypothetical protein